MKKKKKISLRPLSFWLKLFLGGLAVVFSIFLWVLMKKSTENLFRQEVENRKAILKLNVDNVNDSLEALEGYLRQSFSDSESIVRVETGQDETKFFMAKQELTRDLQKIAAWNESIKFLFLYTPGNAEQTFLRVSAHSGEVERKLELEAYIKDYIDEELTQGQFLRRNILLCKMGRQGYLVRFYKIRNSYIGMCLEGDKVLKPLEELTLKDECYAFLCDPNGEIISSTEDFTEKIDIQRNGELISLKGERYLQLCHGSGQEDFYVGTWTRAGIIEDQTEENRKLLVVFAMGIMVIFVIVAVLVQRSLYRPIIKMERGMKQVREGEWDLAVQESSLILEYDSMIQNFNRMVAQIKDLKIQNYEKELSIQKTYLQYLQLQINPHFYLNALNIIYSLAEVGNTELIQEMTLSLVEYSRYMFREPGSLVTIFQEMEHVENYMKIQRMRFPDRIDFQPSISAEIEEAMIPPFIIQSFVENSIKYAVSFEQKNILKLCGKITEIHNEPYVQIEIRDNGIGYSQEVLELIDAKEDPKAGAGNRVGIRNVKQRLELVFGDRARLDLSNDEGAVTTILIPLTWQEDEKDE